MSKTKTIEGVEYIEKSHVDEIVRQRIAKYATKTSELETQLSQYQAQIDEASSKQGLVEQLSKQIEALQSDLSTANSRYDRHVTISQYGITDNDVRDAVEWAYDRAMSNLPKKDKVGLNDWLSQIQQNPETAPSVLRPFFNAPEQQQTQQLQSQPIQTLQPQVAQPAQPAQPPQSNRGVSQQTPGVPNDLLSRASDPTFYSQNRDAIRDAYYSQKGITPSPYKF
jgi:DNA repair exonuclease SbcCD ATPase subunit